jgi:two-component system CheB/CheR fusion protein
LTTVNQELKETIDEVGRANTDLQNLISSTDIATIFLDRELRVRRYTPRTQELFNLIKTDIGRPLEHVTHKLDYGSLTADLAEVVETSQPIEREVRTSNNRWYMVRVFPYRTLQEHIVGVVATFVDITERRQMEHAVRDADRRKDEFLALLSHELRNPLQVLRGVFDIQNRSDNPERIARIWSMAERQADQLHRLVDDLLQVSRISQGKLDLRKQRVSLASVVNLALESSRPALDEAGHTLTVTLPPETIYLDADSARLAQVLTNLLNNAAKYTGPGGRISLNAARNGGQIVIRLRDNGRGIAPEFLPNIFDMFKQAETRRGGLGIGLSLVKQLVEMHGGQVWAHSAGEGQGSEFVVQLPLATDQSSLPPTRAVEPGLTAAVAAPGRRVLVVDDNIDAAESLAESVRLDGHVARTAYTGETAVETALEFDPDIICLDIDLPDVNGYEVAERLRRKLPNALIVAVSGWLREDVSRDRKSAAIDQYFLKPANLENLRTLIAGNNALKA